VDDRGVWFQEKRKEKGKEEKLAGWLIERMSWVESRRVFEFLGLFWCRLGWFDMLVVGI
jgi:hypothetical protein